jgi:hypothetical protein
MSYRNYKAFTVWIFKYDISKRLGLPKIGIFFAISLAVERLENNTIV